MKRTKLPDWSTVIRIPATKRNPTEQFIHDHDTVLHPRKFRKALSKLIEYEKQKAVKAALKE